MFGMLFQSYHSDTIISFPMQFGKVPHRDKGFFSSIVKCHFQQIKYKVEIQTFIYSTASLYKMSVVH